MKNSIIDINEIAIKKFIASKRPEDESVRKLLDFGYSYDGKVAILYEIRPVWNDPEKIVHREFAKVRFVKSHKEWRLFWMRANGKWEAYNIFPKSNYLDEILTVINEDEYGCFFG